MLLFLLLLAAAGSKWKSSMMAAAIFSSSPGRQIFFCEKSDSVHFFRCSSSFSPSCTLNQLLSSSSSRARPCKYVTLSFR